MQLLSPAVFLREWDIDYITEVFRKAGICLVVDDKDGYVIWGK